MIEAIILAGGLGTRLRSVVSDVPKPMAPVNDKPFLHYIVKNLKLQGVEKIILSVGYMSDSITSYFGDSYIGLEIEYAIEKELLGTGGGILNASALINADKFLVLNGDTYFNINIVDMYHCHDKMKADITIAVANASESRRYGTIQIDEKNKIVSFQEKSNIAGTNVVSGGVYIFNKSITEEMQKEVSYPISIETDIFQNYVSKTNMYAFESSREFLDIGKPEDYMRASKFLT